VTGFDQPRQREGARAARERQSETGGNR
jgi:hypothetical protein